MRLIIAHRTFEATNVLTLCRERVITLFLISDLIVIYELKVAPVIHVKI